jgi:hypothetical protein
MNTGLMEAISGHPTPSAEAARSSFTLRYETLRVLAIAESGCVLEKKRITFLISLVIRRPEGASIR